MNINTLDNFSEILKKTELEEGVYFVESMVSIFKKRIPDDILKLQNANKKKDLKIIKEIAHLLSGSLSSMQFEKGSKLARKIEEYSINNNKEKAIDTSSKLIVYLKQALQTIN